MRARYTLVFINLIFFSNVTIARELPRLQTLDKYSRVELPVSDTTKFKFERKSGTEAVINLDDVTSGSLDSIRDLKDARISEITVLNPKHDKASVHILFSSNSTEAFAYFQAKPPKVIIDIWRDTVAATKSEAAAHKARTPASAKNNARSLDTKKRAIVSESEQHAAKKSVSSEQKSSAEDQFEDEREMIARAMKEDILPLSLDRDVFEHFTLPVPELALERKSGFVRLPPELNIEDQWTLSHPPLTSLDGKSYSFAKRLYKQKRYPLVIKAIEIILRDYPQTELKEEALLLQSFALKKYGESVKNDLLVEKADAQMKELMESKMANGKSVPFQNLLRMYFGLKLYKQGKWLDSISYLETISREMDPKDSDLPYVQLMLAFSYGKVNQLRRAERIYRYVLDNHPKHVAAKESYYRIIDILAEEKNYSRVIDEAEGALAKYPDYRSVRKESLFHLAEAYFWTGNYKKAAQFFQGYIDHSTANPVAALAYIRLGEIMELSGKNLEKAAEYYTKAKNGFPFSYGYAIATARLARIEIDKEKDKDYIAGLMAEGLKKLTNTSKRIVELVQIEYLLRTDKVEEATKKARLGMVETTEHEFEAYKQKYIRCLVRNMAYSLEKKNFKDAVELFENEKSWIEKYGPESYKLAAIAYRGIGLYSTANTFMAKFIGWKAKSRSIASTEQDRLVNREVALNAFAQGNYERTLELIKKGDEPNQLYMRTLAEFRLGRKKEAYSLADQLMKKIANKPGILADAELEALLEVQLDRTDRDRDYEQMENEILLARKLSKEPRERFEYGLGDALWRQKKNQAAIEQYKEALKKYPSSRFSERAKYNMGISFVNVGKKEEAVKVLTELQSKSSSVWGESAKQELELIEWEKKYSSVLKTLPPNGLGIIN